MPHLVDLPWLTGESGRAIGVFLLFFAGVLVDATSTTSSASGVDVRSTTVSCNVSLHEGEKCFFLRPKPCKKGEQGTLGFALVRAT